MMSVFSHFIRCYEFFRFVANCSTAFLVVHGSNLNNTRPSRIVSFLYVLFRPCVIPRYLAYAVGSDL